MRGVRQFPVGIPWIPRWKRKGLMLVIDEQAVAAYFGTSSRDLNQVENNSPLVCLGHTRVVLESYTEGLQKRTLIGT
jgi:hypothetical protein